MAQTVGNDLLEFPALLIETHIAFQGIRPLGRVVGLQFPAYVGIDLAAGMQSSAGDLIAVVQIAVVVFAATRVVGLSKRSTMSPQSETRSSHIATAT